MYPCCFYFLVLLCQVYGVVVELDFYGWRFGVEGQEGREGAATLIRDSNRWWKEHNVASLVELLPEHKLSPLAFVLAARSLDLIAVESSVEAKDVLPAARLLRQVTKGELGESWNSMEGVIWAKARLYALSWSAEPELLSEAISSQRAVVQMAKSGGMETYWYGEELHRLSGLLQEAGELHEARAVLEEAVTENPEDAMGWMSLGVLYQQLGEIDRAKGYYDRALECKEVSMAIRSAIEYNRVAFEQHGADSALQAALNRTVTFPWATEGYIRAAAELRRSVEWGELERIEREVEARARAVARIGACTIVQPLSSCLETILPQSLSFLTNFTTNFPHKNLLTVYNGMQQKIVAYDLSFLRFVSPWGRRALIEGYHNDASFSPTFPPARMKGSFRAPLPKKSRLNVVSSGADFRCHPSGHMMPPIYAAWSTSRVNGNVAYYARPFIPPTDIPFASQLDRDWKDLPGTRVAFEVARRVCGGENAGSGGCEGSGGVEEVAAAIGLAPLLTTSAHLPSSILSEEKMREKVQECREGGGWAKDDFQLAKSNDRKSIPQLSKPRITTSPLLDSHALFLDAVNPGISMTWRAGRAAGGLVHIAQTEVMSIPVAETCPTGTFLASSGGVLPTRSMGIDGKTLAARGFGVYPFEAPPTCRDLVRAGDGYGISVHTFSDQQVVEAFAKDLEADVLVDVMGWTRFARTRLIHGRSTPITISYLGWPGSTNAATTDYMVSDMIVQVPERQFLHALYSPSGVEAKIATTIMRDVTWPSQLFSWLHPHSQHSLVPRCSISAHHHTPPINDPPTGKNPHPFNLASEGQILLPRTYQASRPASAVPQMTWSDARRMKMRDENGLPQDAVVFMSIGRMERVGPDVVDAWAQALRARARRDRAVLWVLSCKKPYRERLLQQLAARGVGRHLVFFANTLTRIKHVKRMSAADVVLDSREYNGHSTMTEALWGGTVVVTLAGGEFPARVGASLLYAADRYPPHPSLLTSPPSSLASTALYRLSVHSSLRSYTTTASSIPLTALKAMRDRLARSAIGSPLQSADEGGAKHAYRGMLCSYEVMMVSGEDDVGVCGSEGGVGDVLAPGVMHESGGWSPWHVIVNPSERWDVDEAVVEHRSARGLTHALSGSMAFASGNLGAIDVQEGGDHDGVVSVWHASSSMSCADGVLEASMSSSDPWKVLGGGARSGCGRMSPQVQGSAVSFHLASGAVLHSELYGDEVVEALSRLVRGVSRIRMERAYRRRVTSAVSRTSLHHALVEMYGSEEAALNSREADEVGSTIRPQREDTESMYMVEGIPLLSRAWGIGGWGESDGHLSASSASSSSSPSPPSYASSCICGGMASWCEGHGVRGNLSGLLLDDLFVSDGVLSGSEDCVSLMKEMLLERAVKCSVSMKEMVKSGQVLESWISSLRTTPLPSTLISISRSLPQPHTSTTQPHSIPTTSPHPTTPPSHTITSFSDSESLFLSTFNMSSSSPLRTVLSPLSWRLGLWEARGGMVKLDDLLKSQLSSIAASFRALVSESESTCTCVSHCASHPIPPPPTHFQTTSLPPPLL